MTVWVCACAAGLSVALLGRRAPTVRVEARPAPPPDGSLLMRQRLLVSVFAGLGAQVFLGGAAGVVAALVGRGGRLGGDRAARATRRRA